MPVSSTALSTLADLKAYLGVTATTNDTIMCDMIDRASVEIEEACGGRRFVAASYDEYHDGDGRHGAVYLNQYPIISTGTVRDDTQRPPTWDSATVVSSDYITTYEDEGKIVRTDAPFQKGIENVRIQYQAGFNTVPLDIQKECVRLAAVDWFNSPAGKGRLGRSSEALPGNQGTNAFDVNAAKVSVAIVKRYGRLAV